MIASTAHRHLCVDHYFERTSSLERQLSRSHLEQDDAQTPQVRVMIHVRRRPLLRGHVSGRTECRAGRSELRIRRRSCQTEIENFHPRRTVLAGFEPDVPRLDITMHQPHIESGGEPLRDLSGEEQLFVQRERLTIRLRDPILKCFALQ